MKNDVTIQFQLLMPNMSRWNYLSDFLKEHNKRQDSPRNTPSRNVITWITQYSKRGKNGKKYEIVCFFISNTFISNIRLKWAKNQAELKQHPEADLLLFQNHTLS